MNDTVDRFKARKAIIKTDACADTAEVDCVQVPQPEETDAGVGTALAAAVAPLDPAGLALLVDPDALLAEIRGKLDREKIDALIGACQKECLQAMVRPFGVGRVLFEGKDKDGGNVTTIHNMKNGTGPAEKKDEYKRNDYTGAGANKNGNYYAKAAKNYKQKMKDKYGVLLDETTGRPAMSPETDHIVSCSDYHKSGGFMQSTNQKKEFACDDGNFQIIDKIANISKSDNNPRDWVNENRDKFGMDKRRTTPRIERGQRTMRKHLPTKLEKTIFYTKGAARTGVNEGGRMALQQAVGVLMEEFVRAAFAEVRDIWDNGFKERLDDTFLEALRDRLSRVAARILDRWKEAVSAFRDGFVSGFLSNVLTVVINTFLTTMKRWVRIIREGTMSLYRAMKVLAFPPEGMSATEAAHEASKLLAAGVVTGAGILLEELLEKALSGASWGILTPLAPDISSAAVGLVTGLGTAFAVYMVDRLDLFGVNAEARHQHVIAKLNEIIDVSYERTMEAAEVFNGPRLVHLT